jgi:hypothetical protein
VKAIDGCELTEAEFACTIDSHREEYGHDDRSLRGLAVELNVLPGMHKDWVEDVSAHAWRTLSIPSVWGAMMNLAKQLKRERTLTGDRVRQMLVEEGSYCPQHIASIATL